MFKIDSRILDDSVELQDLTLSQLRLMRDGDLDWFLLVPMKENVVDWSDLSEQDQQILTKEIDYVCKLLKSTSPDKLNVASLGNVVPQMHVHVIARFKTDRAWPRPVWGTSATRPFDPTKVNFWKNKILENPWANG